MELEMLSNSTKIIQRIAENQLAILWLLLIDVIKVLIDGKPIEIMAITHSFMNTEIDWNGLVI